MIAPEIRARIAALPSRTTGAIRAIRREYSKLLANARAAEVMAVARELLPDWRFVAYELIQHHRDASTALGSRELGQLGRGMADWADVDCFARFLAGPAWLARQIPDSVIHTWARSRDRWWRRAALVATVELNRSPRGDARRTLRVCRMLMADRDDMVVKALSWAL